MITLLPYLEVLGLSDSSLLGYNCCFDCLNCLLGLLQPLCQHCHLLSVTLLPLSEIGVHLLDLL